MSDDKKDRQAETSVDLGALADTFKARTALDDYVWNNCIHNEGRGHENWLICRACVLAYFRAALARRSTEQRAPTGQLFKDQVAATFDQKAAQEQAWALEPGRSQESGARCAERAATWRTARDFVKALPVPAPTGQQEAGAAPAVVPARDCLVCPNRAVRGLDVKGGALWCWRHGPFYDSDLFFPHRPPSAPQEGLAKDQQSTLPPTPEDDE